MKNLFKSFCIATTIFLIPIILVGFPIAFTMFMFWSIGIPLDEPKKHEPLGQFLIVMGYGVEFWLFLIGFIHYLRINK